jgi:hypothetical protein
MRLEHAIEAVVPKQDSEICQNITSLSRRLRQRTSDLAVVVLCAFTGDDLAQILALRVWLDGIRTILILPNRESDTIAQGLTLRPSFFSFTDTDFSDVSTVLARMLRIYGKETGDSYLANSEFSQ